MYCSPVSAPCPYFAYPEDNNQFGPKESGVVVPLWHCVPGSYFDEGSCTCSVNTGLFNVSTLNKITDGLYSTRGNT